LSSIVVIDISGAAVEIASSPERSELRISRPAAEADRLAWNLGDYPAAMKPGEHLHHEFYPGHPYLTESAIPLVLERCAD
jgi:hypothetical protein